MQHRRCADKLAALWVGLCFTTVIAQTGYRILIRSGLSDLDTSGDAVNLLVWYYGFLAVLAPVLWYSAAKITRKRKQSLINSIHEEDLSVIGPLVDTLGAGYGPFERTTRDALLRLLPRVSENDAYLLDEYRQAKLRYVVLPPASPIYSTYLARHYRNNSQGVALRLAIVELLARIGTHEALTLFDELLRTKPVTEGDLKVWNMSKDLRPILAARVRKEPARTTLLRAVNVSDPNTLVRAASDKPYSLPDELPHITED